MEWSPHFENIFASSSDDQEIIVWDCSKIGEECLEEEAVDGPGEILFRHSGHRGTRAYILFKITILKQWQFQSLLLIIILIEYKASVLKSPEICILKY